MERTMLYFGSFNPPHNGHVAIARYVLDKGLCDRVWLVVSPRNPFKDAACLAEADARLEMARLAAAAADRGSRVQVCGIEFDLPLPSYTINTLDALSIRYPQADFALLMGADSAAALGRWKQWERIVSHYNIYVYPRDGFRPDNGPLMRFEMLTDAPRLPVSSTDVRRALACGADISGMVPDGVARYIEEHGLWTCANG